MVNVSAVPCNTYVEAEVSAALEIKTVYLTLSKLYKSEKQSFGIYTEIMTDCRKDI